MENKNPAASDRPSKSIEALAMKKGKNRSGGRDALLSKYCYEITAKNGLPMSLFEEIEDLVRDYCLYGEYKGGTGQDWRPSIRHGDQVHLPSLRQPISWHFNPVYGGDRVTVCVTEGREWVDDCYLDEVPVEFLLHILNLIKERRPLIDQRPPSVEKETVEYLKAKTEKEATKELSFHGTRLAGISNKSENANKGQKEGE